MRSPHLHLPFWIRVPATTANLGPGFDALALALELYNYIAIEPGAPERPDPFAQEILEAYHKSRSLPLKPYKLVVRGSVPPARGLGSSATIRLGMLAALDKVNRRPFELDWLIETATKIEGHPDNITAAALGGFVVCGGAQPARARISSRLKFVAAIPRIETSTRTARSILPPSVSLQDAASNLRNASRITAAFIERKYEEARGAFHDRLHQPHRAALVPGLEQAIEAAERAGGHRRLPERSRPHHSSHLPKIGETHWKRHGCCPAQGRPRRGGCESPVRRQWGHHHRAISPLLSQGDSLLALEFRSSGYPTRVTTRLVDPAYFLSA